MSISLLATGLTLALSLLMGCGDDIGKSSRKKGSETTTPGAAGAESVLVEKPSFIHRERGSLILTSATERAFMMNGSLTANYRKVPNILIDDEGTDQVNVFTVNTLNRPTISCGVGANFTTIDARISDCAAKNKTSATWYGQANASSGEGNWKLVAITTTGSEVWLDERSGMVWSDIQTSAANWCQAANNGESPTAPGVVDCKTLKADTSFCVGLKLSGIGENIKWRLPTRNDFLAADLNGIRFVLKTGTSLGSWTATMVAGVATRNKAWVYHLNDGTLSAEELSSNHQVRCIGSAF